VRSECAATTCPLAGVRKAGATFQGHCWKHGEQITAYGITNDIWVVVSLQDGFPLFVSALFLAGDKYGNMPATVECPPYV
jgi:hypothetical protein